MLELGMVFSLAVMGVYFFKSTDLPKELVERSKQSQNIRIQTKSATFSNFTIKNNEALTIQKEIDQTTLEITSLEQQIKANQKSNELIQIKIDNQLVKLQSLHEKLKIIA